MKIAKPDELGEDVRVAETVPAEHLAGVLAHDDALHVHGLGLDDDAEHGQHHRQLVGDQLAGGAKAAEQRVLVGARPSGDQDAERADAADGQHVEDTGVEVGEVGIGAERHDGDEQERADQHDQRSHLEDALVGLLRLDVFFLQPLADLGEQLHRAVRPRFHRTEPALHEAHHLEEEEVDDRAGRQQHGHRATKDAQQRLRPVGKIDREQHHRSMSPRMKYSEARIEITSGTYTPRNTHGTIEMLLKLAERILTRNGPRSPLLTT